MKQSEETAGRKVIKTIKSCETILQLESAKKLVRNFYKMYGKRGVFSLLTAMKEEEIYNYLTR